MLTFFVGENVSIGENILEIDALEKKIRYTVEETVLENTLQNTLDELSVNFNNYADGLNNDTPQENAVTSVINNFNSTLNQLNENERETVAKVYQANKEFFDNLYQTDYTIPQGRNMMSDFSNLSNGQLVTNFAGSTIGAGIATAGAILSLASGNWYITLPFAVAAYPLWQISSDLFDEIIFNRLWVYTQLKWNNITSSVTNNNRTMMSSLEFQNGEEKTINFDLDARGFSNSDNSNTNTIFSLFFSSFDDFNGIIDDLNDVINFVNNIPLIDFGLVDNASIGNPSQETIDATQSLFDNFSFSIEDSNLQMSNPTFNNGNLSFTISIIDETIVTEFVESSINYTYNDETANFSGSFPVKVFKEGEIDLSGLWNINFLDSMQCVNSWNGEQSIGGNIGLFNVIEFNNNNATIIGNQEHTISYNLIENQISMTMTFPITGYCNPGGIPNAPGNDVAIFNGSKNENNVFVGTLSYTRTYQGNDCIDNYGNFVCDETPAEMIMQ